MTFVNAYKHVIGTLFYLLDRLVFGEDAYGVEYWRG